MRAMPATMKTPGRCFHAEVVPRNRPGPGARMCLADLRRGSAKPGHSRPPGLIRVNDATERRRQLGESNLYAVTTVLAIRRRRARCSDNGSGADHRGGGGV